MITENDVRKMLSVIAISFPNYKIADVNLAINLWLEMFAEYTTEDVNKAIKTYIVTDTSGFAPSIGQLVDIIHKFNEIPNEMTEMEAWNRVYKAICNSNYHAQEEFDSLTPLIQQIVGSPNQLSQWGQCELEEVNTVIQSNFMRSYKAKSGQQKEFNRLPSDVKQQIALEASSLVGIGVKE